LHPIEFGKFITSAKFHPTASHLFAYANGSGAVSLGDLRQLSLLDEGTRSECWLFHAYFLMCVLVFIIFAFKKKKKILAPHCLADKKEKHVDSEKKFYFRDILHF
jgi:hypothetical protein